MLEQWPFLLVGGVMLVIFFGLSFASFKVKIPAVPALILLGIALGGLLAADFAVLDHVAEIGIVLLFFLLGLEFPLHKMVDISKKVWLGGVLDVILNLGAGMFIARLFGLVWLEAFVVGGVAYATSSSITIKLLEDKKRLAAPEAEFILALLIFEDLVAPILASVLASLALGASLSGEGIALLAVKTFMLIAGGILVGTSGFRKIGGFIEKYYEEDFMPLFAVGIALTYAGIAVMLGLSEVLGAFLAGMMLSETGRSYELDTIVLPVRNLFLPFFFFWFGTTITFQEGLPLPGLLFTLLIWSVVAKLLVGYFGGKMFGLTPLSALRSGFSLGQRGEFSVIIAALAPGILRSFSGIYILGTASIGMFMFHYAGRWSKKLLKKL
ncbi:MAG: cation:proton antiporter [Bacillota bacterium]|nr:cation:proton antiporter [Bacillota bacterium]MDW7685303.1 cation:proton antiporter [Bacillota bacterium]